MKKYTDALKEPANIHLAAIFYVLDFSLTSSCIPLLHQSHLDTLKNDLICIDIYISV